MMLILLFKNDRIKNACYISRGEERYIQNNIKLLNTQTVKVSQIRWYYFKNGYMNPLHYYPIHFAATYDLCCATIIVQRIFAPVLVRYYFNYCLYMC